MRSRAEGVDEPHDSGRLVRAATLLALACVLGIAETAWLPALPMPGLRLGLANVGTLLALAMLGPADAARVALGRVVVVGLATGTLLGPVGVLSLGGAAASWAVMAVLWRFGDTFSVVGWSIAGSAASVVAQIVVACAVSSSLAPLLLVPLALGLSLPSGLAVGVLAGSLISRVSRLPVHVVG